MAVSNCVTCGAPFRPANQGENVCPICVVEIRTRHRPSENRRRQKATGRGHPPAAAATAWFVASLLGAVALVFAAFVIAQAGAAASFAGQIAFAILVAIEQAAVCYFALAAYWAADRW